MSLRVSKIIPEDAEWIGYRAHDFVPVWEAQDETENRMKADIADQAELPFERNYYLRGRDGQKGAVCWFVQRENIGILEEKGKPDYLELKEEEDAVSEMKKQHQFFFVKIVKRYLQEDVFWYKIPIWKNIKKEPLR